MTHNLSSPTFLHRVTRVAVVACCTVLSVGLIGAVNARVIGESDARGPDAKAGGNAAVPPAAAAVRGQAQATNPDRPQAPDYFAPLLAAYTVPTPERAIPAAPAEAAPRGTASARLSREVETASHADFEEAASLAVAVIPAEPAAPAAKKARVIRMEVTAYCACTRCCGPAAQGITASGKTVGHNGGKFVAADTNVLPFGTRLVIPGYAANQPVEVIDRGGAIKGNKLDLYFPTHAEARVWGRQWVDVTVVE